MDLLDTRQVAELLGIQPQTLELWRQKGDGPIFIKIGRLVRYRLEDVEAFIQGQPRCQTTAEATSPTPPLPDPRVVELEGQVDKLQRQVKKLKKQLKTSQARNQAQLAGLFFHDDQVEVFSYTMEELRRDRDGLFFIAEDDQRWDLINDVDDLSSWLNVS